MSHLVCTQEFGSEVPKRSSSLEAIKAYQVIPIKNSVTGEHCIICHTSQTVIAEGDSEAACWKFIAQILMGVITLRPDEEYQL